MFMTKLKHDLPIYVQQYYIYSMVPAVETAVAALVYTGSSTAVHGGGCTRYILLYGVMTLCMPAYMCISLCFLYHATELHSNFSHHEVWMSRAFWISSLSLPLSFYERETERESFRLSF